jgi:hypothetical protein
MARMKVRPESRITPMARTVTNPGCTPAHVSPRACRCTLRVPPAAMDGETVTREEYNEWDAQGVSGDDLT